MGDEFSETPEFTDEELKKYRTLVNTCDHYYKEYKDCGTIRARFHQKFVFGDNIDCTPRKDDYENCIKWRNEKDEKALDEVTKNEIRRKRERAASTRATSQIWELREEPPSDKEWIPPLPDYLQKKVDASKIGLRGDGAASCVLM